MEIRQMYYFKELAEKLNLIQASDSLYITPQALSKSMRLIAHEYGAEIFYRDKGKLELTTFGKQLYHEISLVIESYEIMDQRLKNVVAQEAGHINIACSHGVMQGELKLFFDYFNNKYPNIKLDIIELPDIFVDQYVQSGNCDLGISINKSSKVDIFEYRKLIDNKICAVINKDHPLAKQKTLSLKECEAYGIITKNKIFKIHECLEIAAKKQGIKLNYLLESSNEILWSKLVRETDGIGIGTTYYKNDTPSNVIIAFSDFDLNWDIYMIYKKNYYISKSLNILISELNKYYK